MEVAASPGAGRKPIVLANKPARFLRPRANSLKPTRAYQARQKNGLQIFPGKSHKDSGLKTNQAKQGPEMKHDDVELILRHMHFSPESGSGSMHLGADTKLTGSRPVPSIHSVLNQSAGGVLAHRVPNACAGQLLASHEERTFKPMRSGLPHAGAPHYLAMRVILEPSRVRLYISPF
jgi:hypothetical protein